MDNPCVFVVGCPRSGTTLLQRMLDNHPQLAVANDSHFIPRLPDLINSTDPVLTPEIVEWTRNYHRFRRLDLSDATVEHAASQSQTYSDFISALYTEYGRRRGKPLAGEKTPDYVRSLPLLHALFPGAKMIHIIRDGRDVALSTLQWAHAEKGPGKYALWKEEPVAVCALWWEWQVGSGLRDREKLGEDFYREAGYEELIGRPEKVLRDLCDFMNFPFAPEMLAYHEGKASYKPGLSAKKAWLPPTTGLRNWRTEMPTRELALFEALAGDLLSTLGYERNIDSFPSDIIDTASRCRQWWQTEMARRREKECRGKGLTENK
ncbi:MAG: sulfotransferase family protein [Gammaproteobacteria bacterium]